MNISDINFEFLLIYLLKIIELHNYVSCTLIFFISNIQQFESDLKLPPDKNMVTNERRAISPEYVCACQ